MRAGEDKTGGNDEGSEIKAEDDGEGGWRR